MEKTCKLVNHVDLIARGIGVTERHQLDELAGIAVRAMAAGHSDGVIHERIRLSAKQMAAQTSALTAIDQLLANVTNTGNPLCAHQAG